CVVSAFVTAWTESEIVWLFVIGGLVPLSWQMLSRRHATAPVVAALPWLSALVTGLGEPASAATLWRIFWYFAEAGAFVFGSGLAVVPFLYGGGGASFGRVREGPVPHSLALAVVTPGPLRLTGALLCDLRAAALRAA